MAFTRGRLVLLSTMMALSCFGCASEEAGDAMPVAGGRAQVDVACRPALPQPSTLSLEVALRGSGSARVHARIYENPAGRGGDTLLAVPGLAETGAVFGPLAEALLADPERGARVARVIAIDLVGRGESSLPMGLPDQATFGELTLEDNVETVIGVIDALRARELGPQVVLGHSMGGLALQAVQEQLLAGGSSLGERGVREAILLAPVPAGGRPWTQPNSGDLAAFVKTDAERGTYLALPTELWIGQSFSTTSGRIAPSAPTIEEVERSGYVALEPIATLFQLVGAPIPTRAGGTIVLPRPSARAGAFAESTGTRLTLVAFEGDVLVPAADLADLYVYLTGDASRGGYRVLSGPSASHSMFVSDPQQVLSVLDLP